MGTAGVSACPCTGDRPPPAAAPRAPLRSAYAACEPAADSADDSCPPAGMARPVCRTCRSWARAALAEGTGTALLVVLGCLPAACGSAPAAPAPLAAALGTGLVIVMLVQSFDHISGAFFNPTVTLAAVLWRRVPAEAGALLVAAQCVGAALGYGALLALAAVGVGEAGERALCVTAPAAGVGVLRAVAVEALLGAGLVLPNCGAWDTRNRRLLDAWPLKIGLVVAGLSYAGGGVTGASMNPARSLGPALWTGRWAAHWVYWAGPLGGGAAAALLYRRAWAAPAAARPRGALTPPATPPPARAAPPKLP